MLNLGTYLGTAGLITLVLTNRTNIGGNFSGQPSLLYA